MSTSKIVITAVLGVMTLVFGLMVASSTRIDTSWIRAKGMVSVTRTDDAQTTTIVTYSVDGEQYRANDPSGTASSGEVDIAINPNNPAEATVVPDRFRAFSPYIAVAAGIWYVYVAIQSTVRKFFLG